MQKEEDKPGEIIQVDNALEAKPAIDGIQPDSSAPQV
jgi:hypothetical protein